MLVIHARLRGNQAQNAWRSIDKQRPYKTNDNGADQTRRAEPFGMAAQLGLSIDGRNMIHGKAQFLSGKISASVAWPV